MSPTGYGKAARQLSGWAANLFATALILVAGLALGRQVLLWWQADSPTNREAGQVLSPDGSELGHPSRSHIVELGNLPAALRRDVLTGDKRAAFAALRARGRQALSEPIKLRGGAGPAEQRMLLQLSGQRPTESLADRWELYELDGPILLVAGIQFVATDNPGSERRVVFWGLAVPQGASYSEKESPWTLFSYQPAGAESGSSPNRIRVPLPASARVTMSLATEDRAGVVGFSAGGGAATLSRQFEQVFAAAGWTATYPWRQNGDAWHGRFEKSGQTANVQWSSEAGGELVGVVTLSPEQHP